MMHFVAFLEPAKNGDRVLNGGFADQYFLKAALQRTVLFQVAAVFVQGGCANAMQVAARQCGFEHVAGIHGAFGLARPHQRVQLVDEQNDPAFLFRPFLQHGLQAFLEFAAVLGAGDHGAQIQREQALSLQTFRHLLVGDPQSQTFHDRGLADARLPDQHRVVLGAPLQNVHGAANFLVPSYDRVQLAFLGAARHVDGVFLQGAAQFFGPRFVHGLAAAELIDGRLQPRRLHSGVLHESRVLALVTCQGQQQDFAAHHGIASLAGQLAGQIQDPAE